MSKERRRAEVVVINGEFWQQGLLTSRKFAMGDGNPAALRGQPTSLAQSVEHSFIGEQIAAELGRVRKALLEICK